jgi:DNA-binding transcriptional LysR family regulator
MVIDLELKHLEAYVKVYEYQSFSKAADEMFLSQPSISAYISALEKELQTVLIHRSTKEFLPTKSGKLFYEYAKDILSLRDKSVISLKNLSDCNAGSIDILASSVPAQYILPEIIGAFHKVCPSVTFNVEQADTADVIKSISAHKSDIGFVGAKLNNPKCVYDEIMSERLVLIAPNDTRFKNLNQNDVQSLLHNEYFVSREEGSGTRLLYEDYLKHTGVKINELKISSCFSNTQSVIHAVANGLGLSIVSELAAKQYIQQSMVIPINITSLPERHFYIVRKKNMVMTQAVEGFIKFIKSEKTPLYNHFS